jgi:hypothetical protein
MEPQERKGITGVASSNQADGDLAPRKLVPTVFVLFAAVFIFMITSVSAWSVFLDHFGALVIFPLFVDLYAFLYAAVIFFYIVMIVRLIPTQKKNRISKILKIDLLFLGIDFLGLVLPPYPCAVIIIVCSIWVILIPNLMDWNAAFPLSLLGCVMLTGTLIYGAVFGIA